MCWSDAKFKLHIGITGTHVGLGSMCAVTVTMSGMLSDLLALSVPPGPALLAGRREIDIFVASTAEAACRCAADG